MSRTLTPDVARQRADAARCEHDALVVRMKGGDLSVTEKQLTDAFNKFRHAELLVEGALEAERKARDDAARRSSDALAEEINRDLRAKAVAVGEGYRLLCESVGAFVETVGDYSRTHAGLSARLSQIIPSMDYAESEVPDYVQRFKRFGLGLVTTDTDELLTSIRSLPLVLAAVHASYSERPEAVRALHNSEAQMIEQTFKPSSETSAFLAAVERATPAPRADTRKRR